MAEITLETFSFYPLSKESAPPVPIDPSLGVVFRSTDGRGRETRIRVHVRDGRVVVNTPEYVLLVIPCSSNQVALEVEGDYA